MDWHTQARLSHEDEFFMAVRWEQEGDIITNVHLKKWTELASTGQSHPNRK